MEPDLRCEPKGGIWLCEDLFTTQDLITTYALLGALVLIAVALYWLGRKH